MQTHVIKDFNPPSKATPFNPAKTVTVPAGGSETFSLTGQGNKVYGFNRILPYCDKPAQVTIKALLNNESVIFQDIQLSVLREYFAAGKAAAPFVIQRNNTLDITLTNHAGNDQPVNVELLGYAKDSLVALHEAYQSRGLEMPTPIFFYGKGNIQSGIPNQQIDVPSKSVDAELVRAAVKSTADEDLRVTLKKFNETVKNDVFVQQFNDEYSLGKPSKIALNIGANDPFSVTVNSNSGQTEMLSFFAEAYEIQL